RTILSILIGLSLIGLGFVSVGAATPFSTKSSYISETVINKILKDIMNDLLSISENTQEAIKILKNVIIDLTKISGTNEIISKINKAIDLLTEEKETGTPTPTTTPVSCLLRSSLRNSFRRIHQSWRNQILQN
ncbi:MAG: hypothetical protein QXN71_03115, partial [Candidatus Aenigmatarchaeota archaeon]